jgi:uncharacterized protein YjdB
MGFGCIIIRQYFLYWRIDSDNVINMRKLIFLWCFTALGCSYFDDMPPVQMDDAITLNENALEIDYEEVFQLTASFKREGYSEAELVWESDREEIVSVSEAGKVTGERMGSALVTVQTKDGAYSSSCEVKVNATNFLYLEPLLDFGKAKSYILDNESRKLLFNRTNYLLYEGESDSTINVIYNFSNSTYKESVVLLKGEENISKQAFDFLKQRYDYRGLTNGMHIFANEEVLVEMEHDRGKNISVIYVQND